MENRQNLINLYKDADFKQDFIKGYLDNRVRLHVAELEFSQIFDLLVTQIPAPGGRPLFEANIVNIKKTLLSISAYGLSVNPNNKEVYLSCYDMGGKYPELSSILGYRGMQRIINNANDVHSHSTEIVYQGDAFSWLGADMRPNYASTGLNQNDDIVCAFTVFTFKDGNVLSHRMAASELLDIEQQSLDMSLNNEGTVSDNLYAGPWRERCLRIAAFRSAFRDNQYRFVNEQDAFVVEDPKNEPVAKASAFERMFSTELTQAEPVKA